MRPRSELAVKPDFERKMRLLARRREIAQKIEELVKEFCDNMDPKFKDNLAPVNNVLFQASQLRLLVRKAIKRYALRTYGRLRWIPYGEQVKSVADIQKWIENLEKIGG